MKLYDPKRADAVRQKIGATADDAQIRALVEIATLLDRQVAAQERTNELLDYLCQSAHRAEAERTA